METTKLNGAGKILSYTIVHEGVEAFKDQVPYVMAIIELEEGPRLTGQIVNGIGIPTGEQNDSKQEQIERDDKNQKETKKEIKIGSRVKCVFRRISEAGKSGTIHYGYKFKLI